MSESIIIKNVGPIQFARFLVPEEGGVQLLRGANGTGKSTALAAIHALTGGSDPLPVRDGEEVGEVIGLGVRLTVAKRRNLRGELSVEAISSDIDPGLLIDPGIKDAEAADLERARVLAALAGVGPDLSLFAELFAGNLETTRKSSTAATRDAKTLPEMAKRIKLDIEAEARRDEEMAMKAEERASVLRSSVEGVDLSAESNAEELSRVRDMASVNLAKLEQARKSEELFASRIMDQRRRRAEFEAMYDPSELGLARLAVFDANHRLESILIEREQLLVEITRLNMALESSAGDEAQAKVSKTNADAALKALEEREGVLAELRVEPLMGTATTEEQIAEARAQLESARVAEAHGVKIRAALKAKTELEDAEEDAADHRKVAESFRDAAAGVWDVVARAVSKVAPQGITFRDGRIFVTTDRGEEYFSDLSWGERSSIAIAACIDATPTGGLLTMAQEIWEGLDPENKAKTAALAFEKGVVIYVGQADYGPLRAEKFVG